MADGKIYGFVSASRCSSAGSLPALLIRLCPALAGNMFGYAAKSVTAVI